MVYSPKSNRPSASTLLILLLAATALTAPSAAGAAPRSDVETAFPTFGVALTGPAGWVHLQGGRPGMITRWGKFNAQGELTAALMAEVEPAEHEPAAQYAQKLAKRIGGKVSPADLGGVKGFRVTAGPGSAPGPRFSSAVLARRGKFIYVLSSIEPPDAPAADAFEAVRAGWKWLPPEPVTKHLSQLTPPLLAFGRMTISLPAIARPFDVKDPRSQLHLGVFDYATSTNVVDIDLAGFPITGDAHKTRDAIGNTIAQQFDGKQPVTWDDEGGTPRRWVSNAFERTSPPPARGKRPVKTVTRYAFVELNDRDAVILTFSYVLASPGERATYDEVADAIVRSIGPAQAGTAVSSNGGVAPGGAPQAPAAPRGDGTIQIKRKPPKGTTVAQP